MSYMSGPLLCALLLSVSWATAMPRVKAADAVDPCSHGIEVWRTYQTCVRLAAGVGERSSRTITWVGRDFSGLDTYCGETLPAAKVCFRQGGETMNCSASQRADLLQIARDTGFWCQPDSGQVNPAIQYVIDWINEHEEEDTTAVGQGEESHCPGRQLIHGCTMTAMDAAGWTAERRASAETAPIQQMGDAMQPIVNTMMECLTTGARDGCPSWRRDILQTLFSDQTLTMPTMLGVSMTFTREHVLDMFQLSAPPRREVGGPVPDDVIML